MKYLAIVTVLALSACADIPAHQTPAEMAADREAHQAYLEAEYWADVEYYADPECDCTLEIDPD